jgi:hypothetical protein
VLDMALSSCTGEPDSGWACAQCDALPPALACVDGYCTIER